MNEKQGQSEHLKGRPSRGAGIELRQPLAKRMAGYALAAGGAGLGVMAVAQPAQAEIVYTPANISFGLRYDLDVNHDGKTDFVFREFISPFTQSNIVAYSLHFAGEPGNGVLNNVPVLCDSFVLEPCAARLAAGARIGSGPNFSNNDQMAMGDIFFFGGWAKGEWVNASGFLGFKFQIHGQTHYGWAEVSVKYGAAAPQFWGVLKGYAYNTVPDQPILAGQTSDADSIGEIPPPRPATLGLLALGTPGLDIWRPRKRELAAE